MDATMPASDPAAFPEHFQDLNDPRAERTRNHPLINIAFIAVRGALSGANSFAAIQELGPDRRTWFARSLDLADGIPSDDTSARVPARLDPGAFEECPSSRVQAVRQVTGHRRIAIDGEALRGSYDRRDGRAATHMVSAWASENRRSLGRLVVDGESNEVTAIPERLRSPDVSGALGTVDAMGSQKEVAGLIREGRGDYVLAVEQNHPALYERVGEAIGAGLERGTSGRDGHQTIEAGRGRHGTRADVLFPAPAAADPDGAWRDLSAVGMATTESTDTRGRGRPEARYSIPSVLQSAKRFADAARGHWGIEDGLRRRSDVSPREDECRVRADHAPAGLGVIRRLALGRLKRQTSRQRGIETKRLECAAGDEYREKALFST